MKTYVLQAMCPESRFQNARNWPWHHRQLFLSGFCFPWEVYLLVQVSYQYHHWWQYDNWLMTIFLHKKLARNPEIENTSSWVLPNILRLEQFREIDFGTNVFNKMLLNVSACQGYIFYCFWIIKEKLKAQKGGRGRGVKLPSKKKVLLLHALKTLT